MIRGKIRNDGQPWGKKKKITLERRIELFFDKVILPEDPSQCWLWNASKSDAGYGRFGAGKGVNSAHRFSRFIFFGDIPAGMVVMHSCDTPGCVNPIHLGIGTNQDNDDDKVRKKRHTFGERHSMAKLNWESVDEIRRLYSTGDFTHQKIADQFNVDRASISYIVNNKIWNRPA